MSRMSSRESTGIVLLCVGIPLTLCIFLLGGEGSEFALLMVLWPVVLGGAACIVTGSLMLLLPRRNTDSTPASDNDSASNEIHWGQIARIIAIFPLLIAIGIGVIILGVFAEVGWFFLSNMLH